MKRRKRRPWGYKEEINYKEIILYSVLGLGAASGLFFTARHFIKKGQKLNSENKSFDTGDPASFARRLKMAFENDLWWGMGTDEEKVYQVFREIPSKAFYDRVKDEYKKQNVGHTLPGDLKDELSSAEADEVARILNSKKLK